MCKPDDPGTIEQIINSIRKEYQWEPDREYKMDWLHKEMEKGALAKMEMAVQAELAEPKNKKKKKKEEKAPAPSSEISDEIKCDLCGIKLHSSKMLSGRIYQCREKKACEDRVKNPGSRKRKAPVAFEA
jgi:hypothetical protein